MVVAMIAWQLGLNLPSIQSVHMATKSMNYNPAQGGCTQYHLM